jgi:hypothetical protein
MWVQRPCIGERRPRARPARMLRKIAGVLRDYPLECRVIYGARNSCSGASPTESLSLPSRTKLARWRAAEAWEEAELPREIGG